MGSFKSSLRDFESFLRIVVGLDEDDVQILFKTYNLYFVIKETTPGINPKRKTSEVIYHMGDLKGTLQIECDNIRMKTKKIDPFWWNYGVPKFDEKPFFHKFSGLTPYLET